MDRISIITYKDKKILFFDSKNIDDNDHCNELIKLTNLAIADKINNFILDVSETHTTPKVKEVAERELKRAEAQIGNIFIAIIGLSNIQRLVAKGILSSKQYFATDIEDAKEWIVSK